jgi:hypothetical protein
MEVLTDLKKGEQAQHLEMMIKNPKYLKNCGLSIAPVEMIFNDNLNAITGIEVAVMNQNNEIKTPNLIQDSSNYEKFLEAMLRPTILVLNAPAPEPAPEPAAAAAAAAAAAGSTTTAPEPVPASTPGSEIQLADALLLGLDLTTSEETKAPLGEQKPDKYVLEYTYYINGKTEKPNKIQIERDVTEVYQTFECKTLKEFNETLGEINKIETITELNNFTVKDCKSNIVRPLLQNIDEGFLSFMLRDNTIKLNHLGDVITEDDIEEYIDNFRRRDKISEDETVYLKTSGNFKRIIENFLKYKKHVDEVEKQFEAQTSAGGIDAPTSATESTDLFKLENLGNTCFANASIQFMYHLIKQPYAKLRAYQEQLEHLEGEGYKDLKKIFTDLPDSKQFEEKKDKYNIFREFFEKPTEQTSGYENKNAVEITYEHALGRGAGGQQKDASEVILRFYDYFEFRTYKEIRFELKYEIIMSSNTSLYTKPSPKNVIEYYFDLKKSNASSGPIGMVNLIKESLQEETLKEYIVEKNDNSGTEKVEVTRTTTIEKMPIYATFVKQIWRIDNSGIKTLVKYIITDVEKFTYIGQKYNLIAAIIWRGGVGTSGTDIEGSGHYYTYKKMNDKWYCLNDSHKILEYTNTNSTSVINDIKENGYILLYKQEPTSP